MLSKEEAVKEIARLVKEGSKLMDQATKLANKHSIDYMDGDGYPNYFEDPEDEKLMEGFPSGSLTRWNSSNCY